MEDKALHETDLGASLPDTVVETRKTPISIVWIVPIVALLIGGWLVHKALSEKGPSITISFKTAEGLEAGKTKIKYKDVEVGKVDRIELSNNIANVLVKATMVKGTEKVLSENTRFWVVKARLSAGEVSGLGTLFSGAYIGVDPGHPGNPVRDFIGLEIPPVVTADIPGNHFSLRANRLGSLDVGSPVYYRQIKVGQLVNYQLEEGGKAVIIRIFIDAPHHEMVTKNTRFWNASGLEAAFDVNGLRMNTESMITLLLGGISFDTPANLDPGGPVEEEDVFQLYDSKERITEKTYAKKVNWLLYFDSSVRGLSAGAPVEFRGIHVGQVLDIGLELDPDRFLCRIPVLIETEPERFWPKGIPYEETKQKTFIDALVKNGLRARLKTGSLLTGQLLVDLDFYPNAKEARIDRSGKFAVLPTLPGSTDELMASVNRILAKLENLPIDEIGRDLHAASQGLNNLVNTSGLHEAIASLNQTMHQAQELMTNLNQSTGPELSHGVKELSDAFTRLNEFVQKLNDEVAPALHDTLQQAQDTIANVDNFISVDASLYHELRRALKEIAEAAKAARVAADYLNRNPDALIYGKGTEK